MQRKRHRNTLRNIFLAAGSLLFSSTLLHGQEAGRAAPSSPSPSETAAELRALSDLVHDLQGEVQLLNSEIGDLRGEQKQAIQESLALRRELDLVKGTSAPPSSATTDQFAMPNAGLAAAQGASPDSSTAPQASTTADRLAKLEEDQEITDTRLNEQNQTKVESGSKYRVRLSGMVLLNLYGNRGLVDNQDFPQLAEPPDSNPVFVSSGSFGGTLRQSQIKLEAFGPDLFGARTSANVALDFAGGFASTWNGAVQGLVRLRTGTIRLDWNDTSIVAGQDHLFFAPLAPTSLATLAQPALSYSGDLWAWMPQIRVEHRFHVSESSNVELQAGILDSLTGDYPEPGTVRVPSWGEESGQPAYAARLAWTGHLLGQNVTAGVGGYYARQNWGFNHIVDGWAGTSDVTLPLGKLFEFTGEFYRGRAVAGLSGGIGQSVLLNGEFLDPATTFKGLDSMGGWAQLKFKPRANFEVNGALGLDNPFTQELRRFQANSIYLESYSRNLTPLVNFIYQLRSDILLSLEYRRMQTSVLDAGSNSANHISLSIGYIF